MNSFYVWFPYPVTCLHQYEVQHNMLQTQTVMILAVSVFPIPRIGLLMLPCIMCLIFDCWCCATYSTDCFGCTGLHFLSTGGLL